MATTPRLLLRAGHAWREPVPRVAYRRREGSLSALMSADKVRDLSSSLVGFREAMFEHWRAPPRSTRFVVAHQAARNLVAALRHARRLPAHAALRRQALADFDAVVREDRPLLWAGYARRQWAWRALTLRRALAADQSDQAV